MPPCPIASTTTAIRVRRRPCRPGCAVAAATLAGSRRASDRSSTSACERPRIQRIPGIRPCRRSAAAALSESSTADLAGPDGVTPPRLTVRAGPTHTPPTSRTAGCERDEYPSHVEPEIRRLVRAGATPTGNGPGSLRTEREAAAAAGASRLRRRAPAIQGSADRSPRTRTGSSVTRVRHRRMRVAPRKARPFVPETNGRS